MHASAQAPLTVRLRTAHDVRHLTRCGHCGAIGDARNMLRAAASDRPRHGRCFIAAEGLAALVALPLEVRGRLTLDDIGVDTMRHLLDHA